MSLHTTDSDGPARGHVSGGSSPSKRWKRKKRIEDILASCSDEVLKFEQGAAIEVAAAERASRLLAGRSVQPLILPSQTPSSPSSPSLAPEPPPPSQAAGIGGIGFAADQHDPLVGAEESGETSASRNFLEPRTAPAEEDAGAIATKLLNVLAQDNTVLESNIRDYEVALTSTLEEVARLKYEAQQMECAYGQANHLRELLGREKRFHSHLKKQNVQLRERHNGLLAAIQQASSTTEGENASLVNDLISENCAIRQLLTSAEPMQTPNNLGRKPMSSGNGSLGAHRGTSAYIYQGSFAETAFFRADGQGEEIHHPNGGIGHA